MQRVKHSRKILNSKNMKDLNYQKKRLVIKLLKLKCGTNTSLKKFINKREKIQKHFHKNGYLINNKVILWIPGERMPFSINNAGPLGYLYTNN